MKFNDSVYVSHPEEKNGRFILQNHKSVLIWTGDSTMWANEKFVYPSDNDIIIPMDRQDVEDFEQMCVSTVEKHPLSLFDGDKENIIDLLLASSIRYYLNRKINA